MQRKFFGNLTLIDDFDEQIEKLRFGVDLLNFHKFTFIACTIRENMVA